MKTKLIGLIVIISYLFISCGETDNLPEKLFNFEQGEGYFILNEGAFGNVNASVSYKFTELDSTVLDIYQSEHASPLGDVLQSAIFQNDLLYLVVNNSAYIKVVDPQHFTEEAEISGFTSPRYIQSINDDKAYVTDLFAGKIWKVDLIGNTIVDSIQTGAWTEEMVRIGEKVYVTSPSTFGQPASHSVFVLDSESDKIIETIEVGNNPVNILSDDKGWIHVFCQGDPFANPVVKPSIYSINSTDHSEIRYKNIPNFPVAYHSRMVINDVSDKIYLLYGGVYEIDNLDSGLGISNVPVVEPNGRTLYGLHLSPVDGNILVTDAKDYNSMGTVYEYKTNGVELSSFEAGIVPSRILWY